MSSAPKPPETYVVGVDYGSLSGRAVVVRVRDGREMGDEVFEYPHAVMDEVLDATGHQLPPDWALQDANGYIEVLKHAVPAPWPPPASIPRGSWASAPTSPPARWCPPPPGACRCTTCRSSVSVPTPM
ncbi:hypothetical protein ACWPM6_08195 [Propionibacterium freudenreichii]|uniref:hypothetical protein n=1 Tax=Propionibacterium freudenreichii TaxID=1744 RepID=UPI000541AA4B|nr:hypothetical protein [Propionibacterium freudenreichii]CEG89233.1 Putative uncharacterized protein [Propionibacterium freudenreichii]CEG97400.1 Putative uncharacterized protein [Propionibacterium freudenreichii]CEG97863.1 Putative uncharacterized protein [Propionibacterium freudenreichii]